MEDFLQKIEDEITGDRKKYHIIPEDTLGLVHFIKSPANTDYAMYPSYFIWGLGSTLDNAIDSFWCDYHIKSPLTDGRIYWRQGPCHDEQKLFSSKQKIIHQVSARFSVVPPLSENDPNT